IRALVQRGHHVAFFEKDVPYYAQHRDMLTLPGADLILYADWPAALPQARMYLKDADVALVTSYCPDAVAAVPVILDDAPRSVSVFYDLDTPVTLARVQAGQNVEYLPPDGLGSFDLVLSYTGGTALEALREQLGARRVAPLYGHVDPEIHRPTEPADR